MANLQERRDKSGKLISYSIRVHRGRGADGKQLKPWTATFDVSPTWTEKSARKKAEAFAATFEKECREGVTSDSRLRFEEYCNYVIGLLFDEFSLIDWDSCFFRLCRNVFCMRSKVYQPTKMTLWKFFCKH